jgi:hypothetical protein
MVTWQARAPNRAHTRFGEHLRGEAFRGLRHQRAADTKTVLYVDNDRRELLVNRSFHLWNRPQDG